MKQNNKVIYEEQIKKNRDSLSPLSIKTYASIINSLFRKMNIDIKTPSDITMKIVDDIKEFLKDIKPRLRKTTVASLVVYAETDRTKDDNDVVKALRAMMMVDIKTDNETLDDQTMSEKQKENILDYSTVMKMYNDLSDDVKSFWKRETLNKNQMLRLQTFVILSIELLNTPRRSQDLIFLKWRNVDKDLDNYIDNATGEFVFNRFKNSNTKGTQRVLINPELKNIMKKWIAKLKIFNHSDYMFFNNKFENVPLTIAKLGIILNNFFERKISTSLLRTIVLTHLYGNINLRQIDKTAENMGTSRKQILEKYIVR
jgi:integrase